MLDPVNVVVARDAIIFRNYLEQGIQEHDSAFDMLLALQNWQF